MHFMIVIISTPLRPCITEDNILLKELNLQYKEVISVCTSGLTAIFIFTRLVICNHSMVVTLLRPT